MIREKFAYRETITTILADDTSHVEAAKEGMIAARTGLEEYLLTDPFFHMSYSPVSAPADAPESVRCMAAASFEADVGPMAAVAATIGWAGVKAMQNRGAAFGLIDNGGDIVLFSNRELRVGIYAGAAPSSGKFAFLIPPQNEILGICTSSATVGPSVSFGIADSVTCFSHDPVKADAWATGLCNILTPENFDEVMKKVEGSSVFAVYAVIGDWIGRWGDLPEIVPAHVSYDLITKG
ncbi:UPF0280 family protein [uncultured Methanocorpusculum sp.]|nr:UPF0280 family protein [uncultured Methanocorpusculum sp.]